MFPVASLAFVGGIVTGSFVGVVAHRLPRGLSIVGPRSVCDSCSTQIAAYDNVPVLSWLLLRGHCRSCEAAIPARYPLVELAVGVAFAATAVVFRHDPAQLALGLLFVAILAAITLTDLERRVIPNVILLAGSIAGRRGGGWPPIPRASRTALSRPPRPAGCCSLSPSPTRAAWGWET